MKRSIYKLMAIAFMIPILSWGFGTDGDNNSTNGDNNNSTTQTPPVTQVIKVTIEAGTSDIQELSKYTTLTNGDPIKSYRIFGKTKGMGFFSSGIPKFVTYNEGSVTAAPSASYVRKNPYKFKWCAADNDGESCSNYEITVVENSNPPDTPPLVSPIDVSIVEGHTKNIYLTNSVTEQYNDAITDFRLSGNIPKWVTPTHPIAPDGKINIAPSITKTEKDYIFGYSAKDSDAWSDADAAHNNLKITVWKGLPPVVKPKSMEISYDTYRKYTITVQNNIERDGIVDPILSFRLENAPTFVSYNSETGEIIIQPREEDARKTFQINMYATDMHGESTSSILKIIVNDNSNLQVGPDTSQDIYREVRVHETVVVNLWDFVKKTNNDRIDSFRLDGEPNSFITYRGGRNGHVDIKPTKSSQVRTYRFKWCATDNDEERCGNFVVEVTEGTPPKVHDKKLTAAVGSSVYYNLTAHGAIEKTEGDKIQSISVDNIDHLETLYIYPSSNYDAHPWSRSVIKITPKKKGTYHLKFTATDIDGESKEGTLTIIIKGTPPIIDVPDVNFTIGRTAPLTIDLANYTTKTDDDPISSYSWISGTLPAGMQWNGESDLSVTVYEDAEDGSPNRWVVYTKDKVNPKIKNIYDTDINSRVIQTVAPKGNKNGFRLGDSTSKPWHKKAWKNSTQKIISWKMKSTDWYTVYVAVKTKEDGYGYMQYAPNPIGVSGINYWGSKPTSYVYTGLGRGSRDGSWQTFTRDLEKDLQKVQPTNTILEVNGFLVRGNTHLDDIILSNASSTLAGIFRGSPLVKGNYTLGVGATDVDGLGTDTFTINVIKPTPPIAKNIELSVPLGTPIHQKLYNNGILPTDGDVIEEYQIRGSIDGISFDSASSYFTGTVPSVGDHYLEFRAKDRDDWSRWAKLIIHIEEVETSSTLCYNALNYEGDCNPASAEYRGGIGCKQTISLLNQGDTTLTDVTFAIDHSKPNEVEYRMCGKNGQNDPACKQSVFDFGMYHFDKGTKFDMPNYTANTTYTIFTKSNVTRPIFSGDNLYTQYKDNNRWHIAKIQTCAGYREHETDIDSNFTLIYGGPGTAVLGDMAATGDAVLYVNDQEHDSYGGSLYNSTTHYMVSDAEYSSATDLRKRNASTATLKLPDYVKGAHIKWAGLFWQGYVHTPQGENIGTGKTMENIKTELGGLWNNVRLKTPDGNYHDITAPLDVKDTNSSTYYYGMVDSNSYRFFYSAYKDVTDLISSTYSRENNTFTVGNILTTAGRDYDDSFFVSHADNDVGRWWTDASGGGLRMGYFGGWSLVVVYDLIGSEEAIDSTITDVYKNVALYNGYDLFATWGEGDLSFVKDVNIDGFKTPSSGDVDSSLLFFGGGADQSLSTNTLEIQQKKSTSFDTISNTLNPINVQFNSTYSNKGTQINENKPYHQGMDLDIFDVSSSMDYNQSATTIRFGTQKLENDPNNPSDDTASQIFPQVIGLSTKLYIPEICYDFDVSIGDFVRVDTTEDRTFTASKINDDPLIFKILLKSEQADFDLIRSQGRIDFNNSIPLDFNWEKSSYSPPSVNAYLDAIHASGDYIAIGESATSIGGVIEPNKINYIKFAFDFDNEDNPFTTQFDIDLNTSIQFSSNMAPLPYILTSKGDASTFGHISRCERNRVYDPILGSFNVERGSVGGYSTPQETYPLYTQIAGREYRASLVHYTGAPSYHTEARIDTAVEVEVIDAGGFDNNASSGFDSVCQDPSKAITEGRLIRFNGNSRVRGIPELTFKTDTALQNTAFRVWSLTKADENGSSRVIVYHNITDKTAFKSLYNREYANGDDQNTSYCRQDCGTNESGTSCYDCLKKHFAVPVCSRDNFAIRPESYRIKINDNGDRDNATTMRSIAKNNSATPIDIAAGYHYPVEINATLLNDNGIARAYYHHFRPNDGSAQLEFTTSPATACNDTNNTALDINMLNGEVSGLFKLINNNVGDYMMWMKDENWTKVDQGTYQYKKHFSTACRRTPTDTSCSECFVDQSNTTGSGRMVGCTIASNATGGAATYMNLPLRFRPYSFDLSGIQLNIEPDTGSNPKYLFMNDFDNPYYNDLLSRPDDMGAIFEGNITAIGKNHSVLTNFVEGCAATDLRLRIGRQTDPGEASLNTLYDTQLQQYLQIGNERDFDVRESDADANITLDKRAFEKSGAGRSKKVNLHTTFKKPSKTELPAGTIGIDPITIGYKEFNATAIEHNATVKFHAEMSIIEANATQNYDTNVTFVYGKVSPKRRYYNNVETNWTKTPIYVDIYCSEGQPSCKDKYDLNITDHTENENISWYRSSMFANTQLGTTDLEATTFRGSESNPIVTVSGAIGLTNNGTGEVLNVPFDDEIATQNDINISTTNNARPSTVKVQYNPVPWLIYDPANDFYRVKFVGPSEWAGVGNAGFVTDINSSRETSQRMNW